MASLRWFLALSKVHERASKNLRQKADDLQARGQTAAATEVLTLATEHAVLANAYLDEWKEINGK